ncbi:hypothetical protein [Curtobacterium sp. MCBD17_040]|uniref:hypothetical protein n=1 Tax=Curtobacterium sp. MCBD17_040 TaxID=2175674 RepID=UPI000DA99546|nr:hypothetical protein [Curtobacterium sp. MCBD17_040]WIB65639.1 hypothetical protein DEI94_16090 [Curtobacterium sp. MCBD17_040]
MPSTRITVNAEATVDHPAERAVIRFRRGNLYDKQSDKPTSSGRDLTTLVLEAGAEDVKVIPRKGKVIISVADLGYLGSVLANLRNIGTVKKPSTSFEVSDETHEMIVAEAVSYAVDQARADVEPTARLLQAQQVRAVNIKVVKAKAVAGTWQQLSARVLMASAYVKVEVTFELDGPGVLDISPELRDYYDRAGTEDPNAADDTGDDDNDPFGGAVFGAPIAGGLPGLAESVGVEYHHIEAESSAETRGVSLDNVTT